MNWYNTERDIHQHVLHAEKLAAQYPHLAHIVERESGRRRVTRLNQLLVTFGGLLITWGNHLQERWAVEVPNCAGTPMVQ